MYYGVHMFIFWPDTKVTICPYFLHVSALHTPQSYSVMFHKVFDNYDTYIRCSLVEIRSHIEKAISDMFLGLWLTDD